VEKLGPDDSFLVENENTWIRDTLGSSRCLFVQDAKCLNGLAARIRQKKKSDLTFRRHALENLGRIVRDYDELAARRFDFFQVGLQFP
jgi:hypothetical protein